MNKSFLLAAGATLDSPLGFWAKSVRVDNPGGQWVAVDNAGTNVAPYTMGAVVPLSSATQQAKAVATAIVGQGNTGAGGPATLTFSDAEAAASAGTVQVPALSPTGTILIGITIPLSGSSSTFQLGGQIPANTYDMTAFWYGVTGASADLRPYVIQLQRHGDAGAIIGGLCGPATSTTQPMPTADRIRTPALEPVNHNLDVTIATTGGTSWGPTATFCGGVILHPVTT